MSIVTFINNGKEQTGKTLSIAAIATHMAIEHNMKILLISTAYNDSTLSNCFIANHLLLLKRNKNRLWSVCTWCRCSLQMDYIG